MNRTLLTLLVANIALSAGVAGSVLYASGIPYPYVSPYAFTYSYAYPPQVPSNPLNVNIETSLAAAALAPSIVAGTSLGDISSDTRESEGIPSNQSTSEPSTELEEATPPSSLPGAVPAPSALGESTSLPLASNELKYYRLSLPITYTIPQPLAWPTASQFHQQDGLGQYNYGYANEHSSKQEFKLLDGITRGAYNYIDAEGKLQTVSYVSDGEGFRVAATNLPQPVVPVEIPDSPEVAEAKAAHLQAQSEAVANVNRANAAAITSDAVPSAGGDNVVSGCNETSEGSVPNEM